MKKRIVILLLALSLTGCVKVYQNEPKPVEPETVEPEAVTPESETATEVVEAEEVVAEQQTRSDYIRATFAEYGYTAPSEDMWIVKEEGDRKIAVVIKENIGKGKPNITKLVFLEGETNTILFLQIENSIKIGN